MGVWMRDQAGINRAQSVCVCVCCFSLFSLSVFCASGWELDKLDCFGETTKAFISVGNNQLQSCLPSTGINLKNLEK